MTTLMKEQIEKNKQLLIQACIRGNLEEVKRLIPVSDPKANNSSALRLAAEHGHIDIVKLLLPVSDPKALNSEALFEAAVYQRIDIVQMLIPVSDYTMVLQNMLHDNEDITLVQQCIDEYEALQLKKRLNNTLSKNVEDKNNSNKRKI